MADGFFLAIVSIQILKINLEHILGAKNEGNKPFYPICTLQVKNDL